MVVIFSSLKVAEWDNATVGQHIDNESHPIADGVKALTPEQKKAIIDLFNTGMKASEIGPELGIKVPVVSALLLPIRTKKKEMTRAADPKIITQPVNEQPADFPVRPTREQVMESALSELSKEDLLNMISMKAKKEQQEKRR